ncbi:unnamed protein product [Effrenium voratum]|uniref:non-specific serine/threonine protein kinase n=1 Tax=Effrenium voratum TaxID=2562239 RepID=A0AA36JQN3_9DINO|nr:unnamed protein product [Effrenium voratum]
MSGKKTKFKNVSKEPAPAATRFGGFKNLEELDAKKASDPSRRSASAASASAAASLSGAIREKEAKIEFESSEKGQDEVGKESKEGNVEIMEDLFGAQGKENLEDPDGNSRARSALEEALAADESLPWRRGRLVLLGQGRAGKTSTVRSLMGKPFEEAQASTVGVETGSCQISRSHAVDWQSGHASETEGLIRQLLTKAQPEAHAREGFSSFSPEKPKPCDTKVLMSHLPVEEVAAKLDQDFMTSGHVEGQPITFSTWDFGGQSVFHTLHHLFLTRCSVYLVVFPMTQLGEGPEGPEGPEGAMGMIRYWLNSLALHAKGAPVLLVGTHKDRVGTEAEHRAISARLAQLTGVLDQVQPYTMDGSDGSNAEGLWFFPIDNSLSGTGSDPVVVELRKAIELAAHEDPEDYLHRPIPIRWRGVLDVLLSKEESFVSMQDMKQIAEKQSLPGWQLLPMLQMFHELGVLFHFSTPQELRDIVILQPQWLVTGMCQLIFDWTLHEQEHHKQLKIEMKSAYDAWRHKGIVTRRLLDRLWERGYEQPALKSFLVRFMEEVALVCEVEPDTFLVPCLLPPSPGPGSTKPAAQHTFWLDFSPTFLPDSLFRRLICYAVQKSSGNKLELNLFASDAFMTFDGHPFGLSARRGADLVQADVYSDGAWLVLHTITNLVEHLRLDFMHDLRYDVFLAGGGMRVKKAEVELARERDLENFRPKGTTRRVRTSEFDAFFSAETSPPGVLVDSQWRQLKSTWPFLARHEPKFGPAERAALYTYLRDPGLWGISWAALESIEKDAKETFKGNYRDKSMWHVVQHIVKPSCAKHGVPIALVRNGWQVLPAQDFITHCWAEPFQEFMDSLRHAYDTAVVKPTLFICAFSLFQGEASDIEAALGQSIPQAPFVKALRSAERYVVVRNRMADLYTRAWCLVEYIYAKKLGFYKDKVLITGPNKFSEIPQLRARRSKQAAKKTV